MNAKKACEIFESLGVTEVTYKGNSVWIESVNKETNEAKVKDLDSEREFTVNVSDLEER